MPYFDGAGGRVHYRSWLSDDPRAAIVFLHGFGEHSGLYERLGAALNAEDIDLWALDQIGHGLSDGERGIAGSIDNLEANGRRLTELAREARPQLPLFIAGHSLGGVTAAVAIARDPSPWVGAVLSGTAIEPPEWVTAALEDEQEGLSLEPSDLSSDEWYLDALANDPLAFTETEGSPLDTLPAAWDVLATRFAGVELPVLFVHGEADPVASVSGVRAWASRLPHADTVAFPGARHDVLNERVHADVADAIARWVAQHVSARPVRREALA